MKRILVAMTLMGALLVVAAGVAWALTVNCQVGVPCVGTDDPDKLIGTNKPDEMNAMQDDDLLLGRRGGDLMFGDDPDPPAGTFTDGDDELFGNIGEDDMTGFGGSDLYWGGARADSIDAREFSNNPGEDTVIAGGGQDFISARDEVPGPYKDTINCGDNVDTVFFDEGIDVVADNCENQNPVVLTAEAAQAQEELASLPGR
jgi:hypothetical protein